jgi:regulator of protease activity HflC (stomatin/prohibitin superfamily)
MEHLENIDTGAIIQVAGLLLVSAISQKVYEKGLEFWHTASASEWLIVLRGGEQVNAGIGMACFAWPGDTIITFPSKLNQVTFNVEQVTEEMQGVNVSGMLIWSVYREDDGPFRCYKAFGDDLQRNDPTMANDKIKNLAISILRDRIANLKIVDILRNRQKLRGGVKEEIQKLLTGWGMWLETVEIQDVLIASDTLFKNMQTEFRESTRQKAENISAEVSNELRNEQIDRDVGTAEIRQQC